MNPFPEVIEGRTFFPKSDATPNYNCISWALSYEAQPIWPDERRQLAWPIEIDRAETLDAFRALFHAAGFLECAMGDLQSGFEKIALFTKRGAVTHASRQLVSIAELC